VKFTALDARSLGLNVFLVEDGSRGVDLQPGDVKKAIAEMQSASVKVINSSDVSAKTDESGR